MVIPNYNKQKYIQKCLDSVLTQTYSNIEIVVVDDCSTDNSRQIIQEYEKNFPNIRAILLCKNGGVSHARNFGIRAANGDIVTMLDSDDYYSSCKKIECEVRLLDSHGGQCITYSYRNVVDEQGNLLYKGRKNESRYISGNVFYRFLTEKDAFGYVQRDMCMPKQAILDVGGYNEEESYYEDYDLVLRLAEKYNFYYTGEDGTAYRLMTSGLASTQRKNDAMQFRVPQRIRLRYIKKLPHGVRQKAYLIWMCESVRLEIRIAGRRVLRILRKRR